MSIISKWLPKPNKVSNYLTLFNRLIRLRLSLMVTFSALTGYFLTGNRPGWTLLSLLAGLFLLSSAASVLNQVQERRQDALMQRTRIRPIPSGEISPLVASSMAAIMIAAGAWSLYFAGWVPMALGLANIVLYNLVYTPLKTRSWLAILPGALVGGVPPLIGWSSAGASIMHPNALFLFIFVCLWQVPHFWLLMVRYGKEYQHAGFSTISSFLDEKQVRVVVFCWGVMTSLFLLFFPFFDFRISQFLLPVLIATNVVFIRSFYRLLFLQEKAPGTGTRGAFILINSYAMIVFILLIVNVLIR